MKTNLRERLTRYRCFIRPKVHFALEFSFKCPNKASQRRQWQGTQTPSSDRMEKKPCLANKRILYDYDDSGSITGQKLGWDWNIQIFNPVPSGWRSHYHGSMETGFVENIKLNYGLTQSSFGLGLKGVAWSRQQHCQCY